MIHEKLRWLFFTLKTFGGKTKFPQIGGHDAGQLKRYFRFPIQLELEPRDNLRLQPL